MKENFVFKKSKEQGLRPWHYFVRRTDENEINYLLQFLYGIDTQVIIDKYLECSESKGTLIERVSLLLQITKDYCLKVINNPNGPDETVIRGRRQTNIAGDEKVRGGKQAAESQLFSKLDLYLLMDALLHVKAKNTNDHYGSLYEMVKEVNQKLPSDETSVKYSLSTFTKRIKTHWCDSVIGWHLDLSMPGGRGGIRFSKFLSELTCGMINVLARNPFSGNSKSEENYIKFYVDDEIRSQLQNDNKSGEKLCSLFILERLYATGTLLALSKRLCSEKDSYNEKELGRIIEVLSNVYLVQDCLNREVYCDNLMDILKGEWVFSKRYYYDGDTSILSGHVADFDNKDSVESRIEMCRQYISYLSTCLLPVLSSCFYVVLLSVARDEDFVNCLVSDSNAEDKGGCKKNGERIDVSNELAGRSLVSISAKTAKDAILKIISEYKLDEELFNYKELFKDETAFENDDHRRIFFRLFNEIKRSFGGEAGELAVAKDVENDEETLLPLSSSEQGSWHPMYHWNKMTDINYLEINRNISDRLRVCAMRTKLDLQVERIDCSDEELNNLLCSIEQVLGAELRESEDVYSIGRVSGNSSFLCAEKMKFKVAGDTQCLFLLIGVTIGGECLINKVCLSEKDSSWNHCFYDEDLEFVKCIFSNDHEIIQNQAAEVLKGIKCLPYLRDKRPNTPGTRISKKGRPNEVNNYRNICLAIIKQIDKRRKIVEEESGIKEELIREEEESAESDILEQIKVCSEEWKEWRYAQLLEIEIMKKKDEIFWIDEQALEEAFVQDDVNNYKDIMDHLRGFIHDYICLSEKSFKKLYSDLQLNNFKKMFYGGKRKSISFDSLEQMMKHLNETVAAFNKDGNMQNVADDD